MIKRLLSLKGIHYLVTRFGSSKLRSLAFDGKYEQGGWNFTGDGGGELPKTVRQYLRKGDLLLMGCGGAAILNGLESDGLNSALGIDISTEAIRLASRFASDRVTFQLSDMESFECARLYDIVLFSESLYYVPASKQVTLLKRLKQSLKSDGVFIVTLADTQRYDSILQRIRTNFRVVEDRNFPASTRHLIVFN